MKNFLKAFFKEFSYPEEAAESLLADYTALCASAYGAEFAGIVDSYRADALPDYEAAVDRAGEIGTAAGISPFAAQLLLLCCFAQRLRERYCERGIDDAIWFDSMDDLRIKAVECNKFHGVWGTFVSHWFRRFFDMTRFALGRLQFETAPYYVEKKTLEKCGISVRYSDDTVVGVHIPSRGRLPYDEVIDAYRRAYDFYSDLHYNGLFVIECSSWLLYPPYIDILTKGSNLHRFLSDFDIRATSVDEEFEDCWRIFNKVWDGNAAALPRDTTMQRQFADYFARGGKAGGGNGVLIFDGEKVVK